MVPRLAVVQNLYLNNLIIVRSLKISAVLHNQVTIKAHLPIALVHLKQGSLLFMAHSAALPLMDPALYYNYL